MQTPDQPVEASIYIAIDVDITDPGELQSYAVARAQTPEHLAMASSDLFAALAVSMNPLGITDGVPGVRILRGKVEPAEGHGLADLVLPSVTGGEAEREPADPGLVTMRLPPCWRLLSGPAGSSSNCSATSRTHPRPSANSHGTEHWCWPGCSGMQVRP